MVLYDSIFWLIFIPTPHPQLNLATVSISPTNSALVDSTEHKSASYDTMYTPTNSPLTSFIIIPSSRVLIQTPIRHHKR